jgi:hypothetical protein
MSASLPRYLTSPKVAGRPQLVGAEAPPSGWRRRQPWWSTQAPPRSPVNTVSAQHDSNCRPHVCGTANVHSSNDTTRLSKRVDKWAASASPRCPVRALAMSHAHKTTATCWRPERLSGRKSRQWSRPSQGHSRICCVWMYGSAAPLLLPMPIRGMYDKWISGSDVNSVCCYGLVYLLDSW